MKIKKRTVVSFCRSKKESHFLSSMEGIQKGTSSVKLGIRKGKGLEVGAEPPRMKKI